jgi:hypothetical protein
MMLMERLSSSLTLLVKFFIPVFWMCFFGAFTVAVWVTDEDVGPLAFMEFRVGLTLFFVVGSLVLLFTLLRLKRVETDGKYLYVTNYFRTARYPFALISKVRLTGFSFLPVAFVRLQSAGIFGRRFFFLASRRNWDTLRTAFPEFDALVS